MVWRELSDVLSGEQAHQLPVPDHRQQGGAAWFDAAERGVQLFLGGSHLKFVLHDLD